MPDQDSEDEDKLKQLQFEMNNTSQANTYPAMPFPGIKAQDQGLAYSPGGPASMNDPNSPNRKYQLMKELEQERLSRDPQRFNRIKALLGQ